MDDARKDVAEVNAQLCSRRRDDQVDGIKYIEGRLRRRICGWLRRRYSCLSHEDIQDIWQETLLNVIDSVLTHRFDPSVHYERQVVWLAKCRAVEMIRKNLRRSHTDLSQYDLVQSDDAWRDAMEFDEAVRQCIDNLPPLQRVVMECLIQLHTLNACRITHALLTDEVNSVLTTVLSIKQVVTTFAKARTTTALCLKHKGWGHE